MENFDLTKYLAEGKLLKEDISSHKKEAKRFLEKFIDDNKDEFEFIPDLETGYIDAKDNSYNVDELASIFLDIGQDIPRGKYNQKYKGEGGTYVVVAENKLLKENLSSRAEELEMDFMDPRNKFGDEWQEQVSNVLVRKYDGHWENWENENPKELEMLLNKFKNLLISKGGGLDYLKEEDEFEEENNIKDYWSEWAAGEIEVGNDAVGVEFGDANAESMSVFKYYVKAVKALNADSKELRDDIAAAISSLLYDGGGFEDYSFDVLTADQFTKIQDII